MFFGSKLTKEILYNICRTVQLVGAFMTEPARKHYSILASRTTLRNLGFVP
jgi:hypothetical protein